MKFKRKSKNVSRFAFGHALSVSKSKAEENRGKFYIESGCTSHILTTKKYFSEFNQQENEFFISSGDLLRQKVVAYGPAKAPLKDKNGRYFQVQLKEALFVVTFHYNLLSVDCLTNAGNKDGFDQKMNSISCGNTFLELFKEDNFGFQHESNATQSDGICLIGLQHWHQRLGHLNKELLRSMEEKQIVVNERLNIGDKIMDHCECCSINKANEDVNHKPREFSENKLDLVLSKICGSFLILNHSWG